MNKVTYIARKFEELLQEKETYIETLKNEIRVRECSKEKTISIIQP